MIKLKKLFIFFPMCMNQKINELNVLYQQIIHNQYESKEIILKKFIVLFNCLAKRYCVDANTHSGVKYVCKKCLCIETVKFLSPFIRLHFSDHIDIITLLREKELEVDSIN